MSSNGTCPDAVFSCGLKSIEYYSYLYLYTPIGILGVVFNCFNLGVLTSSTFKGCGPTFVFLTAMAAADLMSLSLVCPFGISLCAIKGDDKHSFAQQVYEIYIFLPMANAFATASVWITTVVAIERYITVTQVSLARRICTKFYAKCTIVIVFILAFVTHIPYFFYRRISSTPVRLYTNFARSDQFQVYSWIRIVIVKYVPILVVAIFNLLLLASVIKANRKRKAMSMQKNTNQHRQQQQTKCTAMLLGITITFFLCHVFEPFIHPVFYRTMFGYCSVFTTTYRNLVMAVNLLETTSYASNFIFYCAFNNEFADTMKKILRCRLCIRSGRVDAASNHNGTHLQTVS